MDDLLIINFKLHSSTTRLPEKPTNAIFKKIKTVQKNRGENKKWWWGVKMTITDTTASCLKIPIMGYDRGAQNRGNPLCEMDQSGPALVPPRF